VQEGVGAVFEFAERDVRVLAVGRVQAHNAGRREGRPRRMAVSGWLRNCSMAA
jgi:hypothetical protein